MFYIDNNHYYRKGTLAQYLDQRSVSDGEPSRSNLPDTFNPLKFLLENLLQESTAILRLNRNCFQNPLPEELLNKILPFCTSPESCILTWIQLPEQKENFLRGCISESVTTKYNTPNNSDTFQKTNLKETFSMTRMSE